MLSTKAHHAGDERNQSERDAFILHHERRALSGSRIPGMNRRGTGCLRNEHGCAGGRPRMQRFMGERASASLNALIHGDLHRTRRDHREQVVGVSLSSWASRA
jgi:hypothetical protein